MVPTLLSIEMIGVIWLFFAAAVVPGVKNEDRYNFFNIELLQRMNEAEPGNVLIGACSVKAALLVLAEAAAGETRQQILSSLRVHDINSDIAKTAKITVNDYKNQSGNTEVQMGIKLWLGEEVAIRKNYSDVLKNYYGGDVETVNFTKVSETVKTINEWIKKYTRGRISSLADPSALTPETKLLLTSSAYFKGKWQNSFDKADTRQRCFNVPNLGCANVPMMEIVADFKYSRLPAIDAEAVLVPYADKRMAMLIVLPLSTRVNALADLSRDIVFTPLPSILSALQETKVLLQIPRFSISKKIDVKNLLLKLKIKDLFTDNANFTAAFPDNNIKVGAFVHNAQIEVNEEGTVAAAVSEIVVMPLMASTTTVFRADRPFLFFLLDLQTNGILFAGRYSQPDVKSSAAGAA